MWKSLRNVLQQILKSAVFKFLLAVLIGITVRIQTAPNVHRLVALDARSGAVIWRAALSGTRESWLFGPAVASGTVMTVSHDAWNVWQLETFEMTTGKRLWSKPLEPWKIPDVLSVQGAVILGIGSGNIKRLVAVQSRDGHEVWSQTVQRYSDMFKSGGNLFTTHFENNQFSLEKRQFSDGKLLHTYNFMRGHLGDIKAWELRDDTFYFANKNDLCNFKIGSSKTKCFPTKSEVENFSLSETTVVHNKKSVLGLKNEKLSWKLFDSNDTYLYVKDSNLFKNAIYLVIQNGAKNLQIFIVDKSSGIKSLLHTFILKDYPLYSLISDNRSSLYVTVKDNLISISPNGSEQWQHYIGGIGGSLTATDQFVFAYEQTSQIQNAFTEILPFLAW
jgi:hypothetical protein